MRNFAQTFALFGGQASDLVSTNPVSGVRQQSTNSSCMRHDRLKHDDECALPGSKTRVCENAGSLVTFGRFVTCRNGNHFDSGWSFDEGNWCSVERGNGVNFGLAYEEQDVGLNCFWGMIERGYFLFGGFFKSSILFRTLKE